MGGRKCSWGMVGPEMGSYSGLDSIPLSGQIPIDWLQCQNSGIAFSSLSGEAKRTENKIQFSQMSNLKWYQSQIEAKARLKQ